MKKAIIMMVAVVASFLIGWTMMVPLLDFFNIHFFGRTKTVGGSVCNGPWATRVDLARSDTSSLMRAYIARIGIGANQAEEALYWNAYTDSDGRLLDGGHSYDVRFTKRPPVRDTGFWSLTVYDKDSYLVPNRDKRYSVGDRSAIIKHHDGSFIIKISQRRPNETGNWLPCPPEGAFSLTLRMYIPLEEALKRPESIAMPEIACLDCR